MPSTGSRPSGSRVKRQPRSSRTGSTVPSEMAPSRPSRPRTMDGAVRPWARTGPDQPVPSGLDRPVSPLVGAATGRGRGVPCDPVGEPVGLPDEGTGAGLGGELCGHRSSIAVGGAVLPYETVAADGLVLRPPRPGDADDLVAACADPLIERYVPSLPSPFGPDDAAAWIDGATTRRDLVIADPSTDRLLGNVRLYHLSS